MLLFALIGCAIGMVLAIPYIIGYTIGRGVAEVLRAADNLCVYYFEEW
jgi:biopolymer transport protein ExbB/TolQ